MIYTFFSLLGFFSLCSLNLFGFIINKSLDRPSHWTLLKAIGHFSHRQFATTGESSLGHWVQVCAGLLCALWAERSWPLSGGC